MLILKLTKDICNKGCQPVECVHVHKFGIHKELKIYKQTQLVF